MAQAPNGHLLVSNSDGVNADPNQPSEIVEFTVKGQFIGELSVDATPGGAFGLSLVRLNDDKVRFAAVDDNGLPVAMQSIFRSASRRERLENMGTVVAATVG
jgi:hypothetical protein